MFSVGFNRLRSLDQLFYYGFPMGFMVFIWFAIFSNDLNRLPSPDLRFSYGFRMELYGFRIVLQFGG